MSTEPSGEQALIARYFGRLGPARPDVRLGIGDDAALLQPEAGCELVATTDSLVEGAHFLAGAAPVSLGHRAAAVNLSDLAAMGARPAWALLSLTLPRVDHAWLQSFADGFGAQLRAHEVALVGGNLARGPLNIGVQLLGQLPAGSALTRNGASPGDLLCVSGHPGDAAAGRLADERWDADARAELQRRFEFPSARVALGECLRGVASACIDISDGLWRDLGRLVAASGCGARLDTARLPLSAALRRCAGDGALDFALAGGEDYELLFALPPGRVAKLAEAARAAGTACAVIGECTAGPEVQLLEGGVAHSWKHPGFDHFS